MHTHSALAAIALLAAAPAQEARAPFDAAVLQLGPYERMDAVLDVDHDGDIDGVGLWTTHLNSRTGELLAHLNDGRGDFTAGHYTLATLPIPRERPNVWHVTVGDWTGDGFDDVVAVGPDRVLVFRSVANGPPIGLRDETPALDPAGVIAADVTGDGRDDVAVLTANGISLFDATTNATAPSATFTHPGGIAVLRLEANGDGRSDLAIVTRSNVRLVVFDTASGTLVDGGLVDHPVLHDTMPAAGDIDGDGDDDLVVFGASDYVVLRRTAAATFAAEPLRLGGPATGLADVDRDGDLDGVCCGGGGGPTASITNIVDSTFHVSINDGTGSFAPAWTIPGLGARHLAGAVDADGDGDVDLVAGRAVYFNRNGFAEAPRPSLEGGVAQLWPWFADVDRDGDVDLAPQLTSVRRNRGDGTVETAAPIRPAPPANTFWQGPGYHGDFDGDSDPDLIVGHYRFGGAFVSMRLLTNTGGGGYVDAGPAGAPGVAFSAAPNTPYHGEPQSLTRDVDGDGDLDLVANWRWYDRGNYKVWLNDGAGSFALASSVVGSVVIALEDFDGDGAIDAFVASPYLQGAAGLAMWRGHGDGTFHGTMWSLGSDNPDKRWAVGDVDGDGDIDLATDDSSRPRLGRNDGQGRFTWEHPFSTEHRMDWTAGTPRHAHFADVNGDGRSDLIVHPVRNSGARASYVALQNATGGFDEPARQLFVPEAVVDMDGDGDPDILGAELARNVRFHGPTAGGCRQYGTASTGTGGMAPVLGATGPFRTGRVATSRISGALGGTFGVYFVGSQRTDLPNFPLAGVTAYTWPPEYPIAINLGGTPNAPGEGDAILPYVVPTGLEGRTLYVQTVLWDPSRPVGIAHTNGLEVTFAR